MDIKNPVPIVWCVSLTVFLTLLPRLLIWLPFATLMNIILIKMGSRLRVCYFDLTILESIAMILITLIFSLINMVIWPLMWVITLLIEYIDEILRKKKRTGVTNKKPVSNRTLFQQLCDHLMKDSDDVLDALGPIFCAVMCYFITFAPFIIPLAMYDCLARLLCKKEQTTPACCC